MTEREEFEAWFERFTGSRLRLGGWDQDESEYVDQFAQGAWYAWKLLNAGHDDFVRCPNCDGTGYPLGAQGYAEFCDNCCGYGYYPRT
jgi:hypothetical protein